MPATANAIPTPNVWAMPIPAGNRTAAKLDNGSKQAIPAYRAAKRIMDLSLAGAVAVATAPVFAALYVLIKIASPGPVFYSQRRIGFGGIHFKAWKFRTMVVNADKVLNQYLAENPKMKEEWDRDHKLKNDPRITWIGGVLRKTSLDELPQLWNVLKGEMSLVGPRPIVDAEVEKYGEVYGQLERVMPGVTGLWQVSGRNNTTYEERVNLDSQYCRNWSLWFDACILVRTAQTVLMREGAY